MQPEYQAMAPSPRPSPQHSKSLSAPPDCTNCFKQQSNPINSFISKWKYKEDLSKPLNMKRPRPRKQPQTTYHFPLSHTSVNTFNPNNKSNEETDAPSPRSDVSSPSDSPVLQSPRDMEELSPRTPPPLQPPPSQMSPREREPQHHPYRRRSFQHDSPEHPARQPMEEDEELYRDSGEYLHSSPRYHSSEPAYLLPRHPPPPHHASHPSQASPPSQVYPPLHNSSHITPPFHSRSSHSSHSSHSSLGIPTICNPSSPPSSDPDNDHLYPYDADQPHYPYEANSSQRGSKKRRSSVVIDEYDTIEISDSDSDSMSFPHPHHSHPPQHFSSHSRFHSSSSFPSYPRSSRSPVPEAQCLSVPARTSRSASQSHPLSLNRTHDLDKYHLDQTRRCTSLPPEFRLPSINDLPWPMDDTNPRLLHNDSIRGHPRSHSFPARH